MPGLRISAISFLNTAPLMWDFEHGDAGRDFEIEYTIPSACATALGSNQADIASFRPSPMRKSQACDSPQHCHSFQGQGALHPAGQQEANRRHTHGSDRHLVANLSCSFAGAVREISWRPARVDAHVPQLEAMLREHDAALLIGDAALEVESIPGYHFYDLAHLWREATGHAFVFAFWALRLDSLARKPKGLDLAKLFQESRDHGLQPEHVDTIARQWSPKLHLGEADIRSYLTRTSTTSWIARTTPASSCSCNTRLK